MKKLIEMKLNGLEPPYKLTEEMNQAIDQAKSQIANGEVLSHQDANKEISEWLQ